MTFAVTLPSAVERAVADDRRWFACHPGEAQRYRRAFDGEFAEGELAPAPTVLPGYPAPELWVCVMSVGPGLRIRAAYWFLSAEDTLPVLAPDSGWTLAQLAPVRGHA